LTYVQTLKRIRSNKTNYHKRAALLIGRRSFVTVKVSDQNVASQLIKPTATGDIVVTSVHSKSLAKQGWKGSFNNLPACYLTGLMLGKKAQEKNVQDVVLYIGKDRFTSRVAACLKGIYDSGVNIPVSEDALPPEDRVSGKHIAEYAGTLKDDQEKYNSRFSAILKNGLKPEDYPNHFEEIKSKISGGKVRAPTKTETTEEPAEEKAPKEKKAAKEKKEKPAKKEAKEEKKGKKSGKGVKGKKK
jgi:large subunit ribosomal protein L18